MSSFEENSKGFEFNAFLAASLVTHTPKGTLYSGVINLRVTANACLFIDLSLSAIASLTV